MYLDSTFTLLIAVASPSQESLKPYKNPLTNLYDEAYYNQLADRKVSLKSLLRYIPDLV